MLLYVAKRLASAIPTLFLLIALTFFLLRAVPGGPFDGDRAWPAEIQANIHARYGLDQPLVIQFIRWFTDLLHGDLRESFQYLGRSVIEIIGDSLPVSMGLGVVSLLIALFAGLPLGCLAAWKKDRALDRVSMAIAVAGVCLPSYLVASILILIFSSWLKWLPPALWEEPGSSILPALALGLRPMAMIARLTRTSMLDALGSDYIRTATAKGLSEAQVIFKHALRNSLLPVITLCGPLAAALVTGSFVVEMVFQIPGLGKHFVQAVLNRDYPLVMGVTLVYGSILVLSNLVSDLLVGWADPRVRIWE